MGIIKCLIYIMERALFRRIKDQSDGHTHMYFVGQAGYIIKNDCGYLLGVDLYLSDVVESVEGHDGFKRLLPRILEPADVSFDILIATHWHRDHFDIGSISNLMNNGKTVLLCAEDCRDDVNVLGIDKTRVIYVKPGDSFEYGGFVIHFVNCDHGTQTPFAVGVVVEASGKRIYMAGDTCYRPDWVREFLSFGSIDVYIAPINGVFGNMSEDDCARMSELICPKVTVPCHYGMFASHMGSPGKFIDIMRRKGLPYQLMAPGDDIIIS